MEKKISMGLRQNPLNLTSKQLKMKSLFLYLCLLSVANHAHSQLFQPVEYGVKRIGGKAELYWSYPCGNNIGYFVVEKSRDLDSVDFVGRAEAICNGELTYYAIMDTQALKGVSYYRVKAFDVFKNDFLYAYWQPFSLPISNLSNISMYPNPLQKGQQLHLEWENRLNEQVYLSLADLYGREVRILADKAYVPGVYSETFGLGGLNSGVYLLAGWVGERRISEVLLVK